MSNDSERKRRIKCCAALFTIPCFLCSWSPKWDFPAPWPKSNKEQQKSSWPNRQNRALSWSWFVIIVHSMSPSLSIFIPHSHQRVPYLQWRHSWGWGHRSRSWWRCLIHQHIWAAAVRLRTASVGQAFDRPARRRPGPPAGSPEAGREGETEDKHLHV